MLSASSRMTATTSRFSLDDVAQLDLLKPARRNAADFPPRAEQLSRYAPRRVRVTPVLLADAHAFENANSTWEIMPMLVALRGGDMDDILSSRTAFRLPTLGPAVLEPALAELSGTRDTERAVTLCAILANLGVKEERVWSELSTCFDDEPNLSAGLLATYGDERALPLLEREISTFDQDARGSLARLNLDLLVEAYEDLAGELPDELLDHVEYLLELQSTPVVLPAPPLPTATIKVGRNDPCPCGSGKKHKRCCLE